MSFLLDVADPSMHFRARQCRNNAPSSSSLKPAATSPAASSISPSSATSPATTTTTSTISRTTTTTPLKQGLFSSVLPPMSGSATLPTTSMLSAMSRMIRTASSSSVSSAASLSSSPPTPSWSSPSTPEAANVSDPFNVTSKHLHRGQSTLSPSSSSASTTRRPSGAGIATSLSPWMMPSVCDDDQMNKLVSFQL